MTLTSRLERFSPPERMLARRNHRRYIKLVWCKIIRLALVGYKFSTGAQSANRAFFVRNISMRLHIIMAELERDTFECAGILLNLSTNPFQLCHPHLVVNGKASLNQQERINHA